MKEKFLSGDSVSNAIELGRQLQEVDEMVKIMYRCEDKNHYQWVILEMKRRLRKSIRTLEMMYFVAVREETNK